MKDKNEIDLSNVNKFDDFLCFENYNENIETLRNNTDCNENELCLSTNSFSSSSSSSSRNSDLMSTSKDTLNLACTNARSVVEKVDSLVTLFEEMALHFVLLTETWLTQKHCSRRRMEDLTIGANVSFIRKDRGSRGGGVAICYNPTRMKLTRFTVPQTYLNTEIVCAVGNISLTKRKLALISVYMPPSLKKVDLDGYIYTLVELVDSIKTKYEDPVMFIGGDFNGKDLSRLLTAFPELKPLEAGATRRNLALDEVYTNTVDNIEEKAILKPLSKRNGVESDHSVAYAAVKLPKQKKARTITFTFRPVTEEGKEKYGALLNGYDWNQIKRKCASDSADELDRVLQHFFNLSFPSKTRSFKSTDAPWFNADAKRASQCLRE